MRQHLSSNDDVEPAVRRDPIRVAVERFSERVEAAEISRTESPRASANSAVRNVAEVPDFSEAVIERVVAPITDRLSVLTTPRAAAPRMTAAAPEPSSLPTALATAVFNIYAAAIRVVGGPPTLPQGMTTVQVRSSTLEVEEGNAAGQEVPADWYFPDSDEPPDRMIYLQHGFLAAGPMYSYTAAYLADRTNSVVVAPTLTSNPLAQGGMWLGGAPMSQDVAGLFLGNRDALNASADAAGYDEIYGEGARLPDEFVLVGHSLGGGLVAGVAGYYADAIVESGEPNHLAGVILLDGVPLGSALPDALAMLDTLEGQTGVYVPVLELGAPLNLFNSLSTVNSDLWAARENMFNGIVLDGGTHMDSMQGGNPLIQFAAYVVAGFPQPENPQAAQDVAVGWIDDMFEEAFDPVTGTCVETADGCEGVYGTPGQSIDISTDNGTATAVVLDSTPVPLAEFLAPLAAVLLTWLQSALGVVDPIGASELVASASSGATGLPVDMSA